MGRIFLSICNLGVQHTDTDRQTMRPECSKCKNKADIVENKIFYCAKCLLKKLGLING